MILSWTRITKALIRLHGCTGWSAPLLFANSLRQVFSHPCPNYLKNKTYRNMGGKLIWFQGASPWEVCFFLIVISLKTHYLLLKPMNSSVFDLQMLFPLFMDWDFDWTRFIKGYNHTLMNPEDSGIRHTAEVLNNESVSNRQGNG